jgi:hypothetical protein
MLADHQPVDMESSLGVGTARTGDHDARDGPRLFAGSGASHVFQV